MSALLRIAEHELRIMVFVLLSIILASLFMIHPVYAQTATNSSTSKEFPSTSLGTGNPTFEVFQATPSNLQLPTSVSPTSPLYTDLLVNNLFHSFSCLAIGQSVIGQPCLTYQVTKNAEGMIQSVPVLSSVNLSGGTLGAVTSVIGALYMNPPVRTADYLASVGEGMGVVKEANAQVVGSGAAVLNPVMKLWQVSRNISYVIMILIFMVIGLMVMFRNRINPQTVITAQAALPGLVIGLILITFSYFLAGLISDMAFIGTNVVGYYFSAAKGQADNPQNLTQEISGESILSTFGQLTGILDSGKASSVLEAVMSKMTGETQNAIRIFAFFFAGQFIGPLAGSLGGLAPPWGLIAGPAIQIISGLAIASFPTQILGLVLSIIAIFVLIYAMLKLLLRLINAYLMIIFLTISAPFQLLFAALPGRQGMATGWILNMLGNVLVFPAVIAVLYFAVFILGDKSYGPFKISYSNQIQDNGIVPLTYAADKVDIAGSVTFPLFGGMDLGFLKIILAFGLLVALPSIPDIVIKSVGKANEAGQMIGQEISGGIRGGQGYAGQTRNAVIGQTQQTAQQFFGKKGLVYDPYEKQFKRMVTEPGIRQLRRGTTANPKQWRVSNE